MLLRRISATRRAALVALATAGLLLVAFTGSAFAQSASISAPGVQVQVGGPGGDNATALQFCC
jgi:hypothetical protein